MKDIIQKLRVLRYKFLSKKKVYSGYPKISQPVLFLGKGRILFEDNVTFGYKKSPYFFSGYSHVEARTPDSVIEFGQGCQINNSCVFISEGPGIKIGKNCLIGPEVVVFDSDFHGLVNRQVPLKKAVTIADNVFIGARAVILKGVTVGENSTIAAGSVVIQDVAANCVVAGNPARVVKELL